MPTTPTYGLPYPTGTDKVNETHLFLQQLAEAVEADLAAAASFDLAERGKLPKGLVLLKRPAANQTGITTAHTYLAQDFGPFVGRAYRVSTGALVSSTVAGDDVTLTLNFGGTQVAGSSATERLTYAGGTSGYWLERSGIVRSTQSNPVSVNAVIARTIGTGSLTVSSVQTYIAVEDLGLIPTAGAVVSA